MSTQETTDNQPEECWCDRSPTGLCCGWHKLSEDEYQEALAKYNADNA